jgi:nitrogen regulatory protein PII
VVNQGYSDELMAAAREAGAGGGTVINVRGLMHEGPVRFFGISVQEEREAIMILASKEKKIPIMRAVSRDFGIGSKAAGVVYALPVDSVLGINLN